MQHDSPLSLLETGGGIWAGVRDHYVVATKGMWPLIHTTEANSSYWVVVAYSECSMECFRPHLCHCGQRSEGHWNELLGSSSHPRRSATRPSSSHHCPPLLWQQSHQVCLPGQPPVGGGQEQLRTPPLCDSNFPHLQYDPTYSLPRFMVKENFK